MPSSALAVTVAGIDFQNPVLLAAGTAAYGRELSRVIDLDALGGIVTKAVSVEKRDGAPAPRVAEFEGGMINAVGLANPGVEEVRSEHLPWLAQNLRRAKVIVNVVGSRAEDFVVIETATPRQHPDLREVLRIVPLRQILLRIMVTDRDPLQPA